MLTDTRTRRSLPVIARPLLVSTLNSIRKSKQMRLGSGSRAPRKTNKRMSKKGSTEKERGEWIVTYRKWRRKGRWGKGKGEGERRSGGGNETAEWKRAASSSPARHTATTHRPPSGRRLWWWLSSSWRRRIGRGRGCWNGGWYLLWLHLFYWMFVHWILWFVYRQSTCLIFAISYNVAIAMFAFAGCSFLVCFSPLACTSLHVACCHNALPRSLLISYLQPPSSCTVITQHCYHHHLLHRPRHASGDHDDSDNDATAEVDDKDYDGDDYKHTIWFQHYIISHLFHVEQSQEKSK